MHDSISFEVASLNICFIMLIIDILKEVLLVMFVFKQSSKFFQTYVYKSTITF